METVEQRLSEIELQLKNLSDDFVSKSEPVISWPLDKITQDSVKRWLGDNFGLVSGVYTPTLTNVANVAASTAYECQYMRVGSMVLVSGKLDIDATAAAATRLAISLPIESNLGAAEDCAGVAGSSLVADDVAAILGDATNNRAELNYIAVSVANHAMFFNFMYQILK